MSGFVDADRAALFVVSHAHRQSSMGMSFCNASCSRLRVVVRNASCNNPLSYTVSNSVPLL
jgi:hypothetical protein